MNNDSIKLTPREQEIMEWAAEGKTNWETAQILEISEHTVVFHRKRIFRKLDASNVTTAVAKCIRRGLIL